MVPEASRQPAGQRDLQVRASLGGHRAPAGWSQDKLLVAHDWDSVTADSEAVLAGFAAALYSTVSVKELATVE